MCSDTECLELLIVLHIYLFFMSYDSSNVNLGDIETTVYTISPERSIVTYFGVNLIFN